MFRFLVIAGIVLGLAGCVVAPPAYVIAVRNSAKQQTLHIKDKESIAKKDGHEYRVYTDRGVFVVQDTLSFWNWRAADRYNQLEAGRTYHCKTAGWRIGLFSAFPNIIDCKEW